MYDIAQAQPVTVALRERMEDAVETLLALLDEMDGNPDLEDGRDDEPPLAGPQGRGEDDRELDTSDDEPYLSTGVAVWNAQSYGEVDVEGDDSEGDGHGLIEGGQGA